MKQYITKEQFDELSNKGKEKLLDWILAKKYLVIASASPKINKQAKVEHFALRGYALSIGQMIEFLDDGKRPMVFIRHSAWHGHGWSLNYLKNIPTELREASFINSSG